jgi:DNA-binding beta-propeller fold protein YncE
LVRRAVILLLLCTAAAAGAEPIRQVTLPNYDRVYDRITQRIYASVPSSAESGGNSITAIDPVTGGLGTPLFVGSEPGRLALSNDGQSLYVVW